MFFSENIYTVHLIGQPPLSYINYIQTFNIELFLMYVIS
jgi:hypothetical protein